jgi:predicted outer membrane protein
MKKKGVQTFVSVLLVTGLTICISAKAQGLSSEEQAFVKNPAMGGLAEVELSQLANERASDMKVKDFARRMITDHTQANDELKPLPNPTRFPCRASWREKAK